MLSTTQSENFFFYPFFELLIKNLYTHVESAFRYNMKNSIIIYFYAYFQIITYKY